MNSDITINKKFLELFNKGEMNDIISHASAVSEDCIVIATETHFFELSANIVDSIDIYCDGHDGGSSKKLTKNEFIKIYKSSPLMNNIQADLDL